MKYNGARWWLRAGWCPFSYRERTGTWDDGFIVLPGRFAGVQLPRKGKERTDVRVFSIGCAGIGYFIAARGPVELPYGVEPYRRTRVSDALTRSYRDGYRRGEVAGITKAVTAYAVVWSLFFLLKIF